MAPLKMQLINTFLLMPFRLPMLNSPPSNPNVTPSQQGARSPPSQHPILAPSPFARRVPEPRHRQRLAGLVIIETAIRYGRAVQRHVCDGTLHAQNGHVGEWIGVFVHPAPRGIQSLVRSGELVRIRDLDSGRFGEGKAEGGSPRHKVLRSAPDSRRHRHINSHSQILRGSEQQ